MKHFLIKISCLKEQTTFIKTGGQWELQQKQHQTYLSLKLFKTKFTKATKIALTVFLNCTLNQKKSIINYNKLCNTHKFTKLLLTEHLR